MGSYQRGWSDVVESEVSAYLSGDCGVTSYNAAIGDEIKTGLAGKLIKSSDWSGKGNYSEPGDIRLTLDDDSMVFVELKCSKNVVGSGTKANLGQASFKNSIPELLSYSEFDEKYKKLRYTHILHLTNKENISEIKKSEYENVIRNIRDEYGKVGLSQIVKIATESQEGYAKYIADNSNSYMSGIQAFSDRLSNSQHESTNNKKHQLLYCVVNSVGKENQTISIKQFTPKKIHSVVSKGKSIIMLDESKKVVWRISVHWKNICQGGATPCFNVFDGGNK